MKTSTPTRGSVIGLAGLSVLVLAASAAGQDRQQIAEAVAANLDALKGYTWTRSTEVQEKGEVISTTRAQLYYDIDGSLQEMSGQAPSAPAGTPPSGAGGTGTPSAKAGPSGPGSSAPTGNNSGGRGRGGRKGKKRGGGDKDAKNQAKAIETGVAVGETGVAYALLDAESLSKFFEGATVEESSGKYKVQGQGLLHKDDTVKMELDPDSMLPVSLEADGRHDGKPIQVTATYQSTSAGQTGIARLIVSYESKNLRVAIDDTNYRTEGQSGTTEAPNPPFKRRRR